MATVTINVDIYKYPSWSSDTLGGVYSTNDLTNYLGLTYRNITGTNTDTVPSSDTTNWVLDLSRAKLFVGRNGVFDGSAESNTRSWNAITNLPNASDLLGLTGHTILGLNDNDSVIITVGQTAYYSQVGQTTPIDSDGELSETNGGDNRNIHLAGIIKAFHSDLIKDDNDVGSHGVIVGGSWKQVAGDYSGSYGGQYHQIYAQHTVVVGGREILVGDISDAILVRHSFVGGGQLITLLSSVWSAMLGGKDNTMTSSDYSAIMSGINHVMTGVTYSAIVAGQNSEITGDESITLAGRNHVITSRGGVSHGENTVNEMTNSRAHGGGENVSGKICQTYEVAMRRRTTLTADFISPDASGGGSLFAPPANSIITVEFNINAIRSDVVGDYASYHLRGSLTTVGGSLIILSQTTTTDHETDAAYDCSIHTDGTLLRIRINSPSSQTNNWVGNGKVLIQAV